MVEHHFKRKLSAILSADAVGYSRLMQADEATTIRSIEASKRLMSEVVVRFKGRVVDAPGDNLLAEFPSIVQATECAVELQKQLQTINAAHPENRRLKFRIGINLGDVVQEADRIYGDGVNIAARIESLAEPGGICLSRTAFDQVKGKLEIGFEYMGEHAVKNISEPVRVYRVLSDPEFAGKVIGEKVFGIFSRKLTFSTIAVLALVCAGIGGWLFYLHQAGRIEPADAKKMAFPLPEKPSVAVLPFKDLIADLEHKYVVDGTTDAVRIALAKVPNLFVIDHNTTSHYRDQDRTIKQVAEDLGVRYIVGGSVQRFDGSFRVQAKLMDAVTGRLLWADTFDRKGADIISIQDEVSQKIITELEVQLTEGQQARIWNKQTNNLEAYKEFRIAVEHYRKRTKQDNITARKHHEEAIKIDPNYAEAKCHLGFTYIQEAINGWTKNKKESFSRAKELAQQAIDLDPFYPHSYTLLGSVYLWKGEREKALELITHSIDLEPSYAGNIAMQALTLVYMERPGEALEAIESAMRLNPYYPHWYLGVLGRTFLLLNRYDDAVDAFRTRRSRSKSTLNMVELAIANSLVGKDQDAKKVADEILKRKPNFALKYIKMFFQYKNPETTERFFAAAQKAGIPR